MSANGTTEVNIFGQTYHIQGGGDSEQARQAAALVDEKMKLIASQVRSPERFRVAVLAALHLADEYLTARQQAAGIEKDVAVRSEQIVALLDKLEEPEEDSPSYYHAAS
jgi:cell division protein ZapA